MRRHLLPLAILAGVCLGQVSAAPVTPEAIMGFQTIKHPQLADNGQVVAFTAQPDRGDPEGRVRRANGQLHTVARAEKPVIATDGHFVLFEQPVTLLEKANAKEKEKKKLKPGRVLVNVETGAKEHFERVKAGQFSHDGRFLVLHFEPAQENEDNKDAETIEPVVIPGSAEETPTAEIDEQDLGSELLVRDLSTGDEVRLANVRHVALAEDGFGMAYSTSHEGGEGNGVYLLDDTLAARALWQGEADNLATGALVWQADGARLAFTLGDLTVKPRQREHRLALYEGNPSLRWQALNHADFLVSGHSELTFSRDGQRLFVGRQVRQAAVAEKPEFEHAGLLQDIDTLLARKNLVLWHGEDEQIKTREVHQYDDEHKRLYQGVWHLEGEQFIQLADPRLPELVQGEQRHTLLASSDKPYRKAISWAGFYRDWYLVDLRSGERRHVIGHSSERHEPSLSPLGEHLVWHLNGALYWHDVIAGETRKLAEGFANEDHDYPSPAPGYGFGPWLENDTGLLLYDKYDIWRFSPKTGQLARLTQGRETGTLYRVQTLDEDQPFVAADATLLVHGANEQSKDEGVYRLSLADNSLATWQAGAYKVKALAQAKGDDSDALMLSFERYDQYPDLYLAADMTTKPKQVSQLGTQLDELDWGQAQLVRWQDSKGQDLKGVLITPPGYQGDKPLPTVIYFYRFMSDRLHAFPQMALNHRPNFAWYASEGYAIFLPDIVFEIGAPGPASVDALVTGADHLIELGVADKDAIGLQGHSWAGYQSAFIVTQTDKFASVVTGAPVANMTSAYTGIRLGSGLGRQFQYEAGQSRIGESLYAAPQPYIDNSPVFFADKITTPMVIMFGDVDDAVPWQQGIELYLALRRLGKDVVMLQYEDEPHHLKKYPNKLDYSLRMKQFFDHTLKGAKAPRWWRQGLPYRKPAE